MTAYSRTRWGETNLNTQICTTVRETAEGVNEIQRKTRGTAERERWVGKGSAERGGRISRKRIESKTETTERG